VAHRFLENIWVPALVRESYSQPKVYLKMKTGGSGSSRVVVVVVVVGSVCLTEAFRL